MKNSAGTHRDVSQCFPSRCLALLDQVSSEMPGPPCLGSGNCEVEPLETGVDTHTHTVPLGGARVEGLNRYLKSLRNKRKKHRKSSAKRAREKDRSRKMKNEYLALDWGREMRLKNNLKSLRESPRNDQKRKKESGGQGGGVCGMCVSVCVCV